MYEYLFSLVTGALLVVVLISLITKHSAGWVLWCAPLAIFTSLAGIIRAQGVFTKLLMLISVRNSSIPEEELESSLLILNSFGEAARNPGEEALLGTLFGPFYMGELTLCLVFLPVSIFLGCMVFYKRGKAGSQSNPA